MRVDVQDETYPSLLSEEQGWTRQLEFIRDLIQPHLNLFALSDQVLVARGLSRVDALHFYFYTQPIPRTNVKVIMQHPADLPWNNARIHDVATGVMNSLCALVNQTWQVTCENIRDHEDALIPVGRGYMAIWQLIVTVEAISPDATSVRA